MGELRIGSEEACVTRSKYQLAKRRHMNLMINPSQSTHTYTHTKARHGQQILELERDTVYVCLSVCESVLVCV